MEEKVQIIVLATYLNPIDDNYEYEFYCTGRRLNMDEVYKLGLSKLYTGKSPYCPAWYEVQPGNKIYYRNVDRDRNFYQHIEYTVPKDGFKEPISIYNPFTIFAGSNQFIWLTEECKYKEISNKEFLEKIKGL